MKDSCTDGNGYGRFRIQGSGMGMLALAKANGKPHKILMGSSMIRDRQEQRKLNLLKLKTAWGDEWVRLAQKLGYSNATYLHHLVSGHRPFSEKIARSIERKLSLEYEWLDVDHGLKAPLRHDDGLLEQVIAAVESAREVEGIEPQALTRKFGQLVAFAYEVGREHGLQGERWYRSLLRLILQE
jgi:hypothetical protein